MNSKHIVTLASSIGFTPSLKQPGEFILIATMYDQYGRELDQTTQAVVARATDWNIGINSLTSNGDITVGIQRTGYSILAEAVCELAVSAEGGWSSTYYVDVAYSDFAPVILIENPGGIEKDEKITAVLSCSVPFDVDDDPEDDSRSTYYKSENLLAVSSNDVGWIIGVAGLVLVVAWLLGAIQAPTSQARKPTSSKPETEKTSNEKTAASTMNEPLDDIQIQPDEGKETGDSEPVVEEETIIESTIEIIESVEESTVEDEDTTASGRLANLRDEMDTDGTPERTGSIEDRMKKFFGNE